ncbi:MAG: OsmC family protein [Anaerovoracaceae bacterium]|jgi:uncharacterized OsmC-like protein
MLTTFKATSVKTEQSLQVESEARTFKITMDEPKEMGGTDTGMNPVEAVLCAFGACQSIVCAAFAKAQGFQYDKLWVDVEGDLDTAGMKGAKGVRPGFSEVRYTLHFKTDEPQEKVDAFADFMADHCPVGDIIANPVKVVRTAAVKE